MSDHYNDDEFDAEIKAKKETRKLIAKIIFWVLLIGSLIFFVGFKFGQRSVTKTITAPTTLPTEAPPIPTAKPTSTAILTTEPTATIPTEIETEWIFNITDITGGGDSAEISVLVRHNGCFKGLDLWECHDATISLSSTNGRTLYINDYENKISYVVERNWVTIVWSNNMNLFFKRSFDIGQPPSLP